MSKQTGKPSPYVETYDLNDPTSWQEMHGPDPGQEISAASYRALLERVLAERGWIRNDEFLAIVEEIFGPLFGPEDTTVVQGRPKWMNNVDWAKASLTSAGSIMTRSRQRKGKKETFIVSTEHADLVVWVMSKTIKSGFKKKCPKCNQKRPLGEEFCGALAKGGCGYRFPEPNERVHRLPT